MSLKINKQVNNKWQCSFSLTNKRTSYTIVTPPPQTKPYRKSNFMHRYVDNWSRKSNRRRRRWRVVRRSDVFNLFHEIDFCHFSFWQAILSDQLTNDELQVECYFHTLRNTLMKVPRGMTLILIINCSIERSNVSRYCKSLGKRKNEILRCFEYVLSNWCLPGMDAR